jgi:hypothetical protein
MHTEFQNQWFGGIVRADVMKSLMLMLSVLAATIGMCARATGEQPRPSKSNEVKPGEKKAERLADRCQKMLDLQVAVFDGTRALNKVIEGHADKMPRPKDKQTAVKLLEKQKAVIVEATAAIEMLKTQGAAAAFPEVFEELRADMKRVQCRIDLNDVGSTTQAIEQDIIDTLREMIQALNKT